MTRRSVLAAVLLAVCVGAVSWQSGPDSFDYIDGTEFVLCARELGTPHPPGYPLFIFVLRTSSEILPGAMLDYDAFRVITTILASAVYIAGVSVLMSFGAGAIASLLGSLLLVMSGSVLGQLNLVEIHGFGMFMALIAIRFRRSRCGPYLFSLSVFGGHPLSLFILPFVLNRRFREKWVLLAAIPATLLLFVPVRAMQPALAHYGHPNSLKAIMDYFTLYSSYFSNLSDRLVQAILISNGRLPFAILVMLMALSGKIKWKLLLSIALGALFFSFYWISDTDSMLWTIFLPMAIWATFGLERLISKGKVGVLLAVLLVFLSAGLGMKHAWREGDSSASIVSRDIIRGVGSEGILVTVGFCTFSTAYLMEVEDRRPDIIAMDRIDCFFRIEPPEMLPVELADRSVYTNRGWDQELLEPSGILFSAEDTSATEIDWGIYDLFWMDDDVVDDNARMILADLWVMRGLQTENERSQAVIWSVAQTWAGSGQHLAWVNARINEHLYKESVTAAEGSTLPDLISSYLIEPLIEDTLDSQEEDSLQIP